ncbi:MAG: KpsF/GutQ family sugar-phosphate isomerase [Planctomycetota bacterium]
MASQSGFAAPTSRHKSHSSSLEAPRTPLERLRVIRETVRRESEAMRTCADSLTQDAVWAAEKTAECEGCIIITGIGKAGWVGQKIAATLSSIGCPSHFLHPSEAVHGDLGRVRSNDLVWAFSNSGRSEEILSIASHLRENSSGLVAITADDESPLAAAADCVVSIGRHQEACPIGLAPTSSTTVMMAVGDSIAMLASQLKRFTAQDFAKFHPGGALGQKLATVNEIMRPLDDCRVAKQDTPIRQAMVVSGRHGRRSGAVLLTDTSGRLSGIFTDSDLARLLESRRDEDLDRPIEQLMTHAPHHVESGASLQEAIAILSRRRISELPVVDAQGYVLGLVDITDVVSFESSPNRSQTASVRLTTFG